MGNYDSVGVLTTTYLLLRFYKVWLNNNIIIVYDLTLPRRMGVHYLSCVLLCLFMRWLFVQSFFFSRKIQLYINRSRKPLTSLFYICLYMYLVYNERTLWRFPWDNLAKRPSFCHITAHVGNRLENKLKRYNNNLYIIPEEKDCSVQSV